MRTTARRQFLASTAAAGGALALPSFAVGGSGRSGSDKIRVVGVGGMGGYAVQEAAKEVLVAFCDVDDERAGRHDKNHPGDARRDDRRRRHLGMGRGRVESTGGSTEPAPDRGRPMALDVARQRVVLLAGAADTWEWDGMSWTRQTATPRPTARAGHAICRDASRSSSLLCGGTTEGVAPDETWRHGALLSASAAAFVAGCPGTPGVPVLTGSPPYAGCPAVSLELLAVQPGAACVIGLAPRTASQPLGGCTWFLTDPLWASVAVADSDGAARVVVPGPAPASPCTGATLCAQGIVLDLGGPDPQLALSAGLRLVVGDGGSTAIRARTAGRDPPAHAPAEPRGSEPGSG